MESIAVLTVFDVKLGLAIHVKAPNGKYIIIDLGNDVNKHPLMKRIRDDIGYMVLTHPHLDHFSDIGFAELNKPKILRRVHALSRTEVMNHADDSNVKLFANYCDFVENYNQIVLNTNPYDTTNPANYGGLEINTFSVSDLSHNDFNNFSIITVLVLCGIKIVVCGDNTVDSLNELLGNHIFKECVANAEVLVAPHHGRLSCFNEKFVKTVNPRLTIISDGKYTDASGSDEYGNVSRGWDIWNRQGDKEKRKCLTTRKDGDIQVKFGMMDNGNKLLCVSLI